MTAHPMVLFICGLLYSMYSVKHVAAETTLISKQGTRSSSPRIKDKQYEDEEEEEEEKEEEEEEEKGHRGPIFLANVVTQQYRYRWMVAAISVFVTMTIVVVVSVIYSNQ